MLKLFNKKRNFTLLKKNMAFILNSNSLWSLNLTQFTNFNENLKDIFTKSYTQNLIINYNSNNNISEENRLLINESIVYAKKFKKENINDGGKVKNTSGRNKIKDLKKLSDTGLIHTNNLNSEIVVSFDKNLHLYNNNINNEFKINNDVIDGVKSLNNPLILSKLELISLIYDGKVNDIYKLKGINYVKANKIYKKPNLKNFLKTNFDEKILNLKQKIDKMKDLKKNNLFIQYDQIKELENSLDSLNNSDIYEHLDELNELIAKNNLKIADFTNNENYNYNQLYTKLSNKEKDFVNEIIKSTIGVLNTLKFQNFVKVQYSDIKVPQLISILESVLISQLMVQDEVIKEIINNKCLLEKCSIINKFINNFKNSYNDRWKNLDSSIEDNKNDKSNKKTQMKFLYDHLMSLQKNELSPSKKILVKKVLDTLKNKNIPEKIKNLIQEEFERFEELNEQDSEFVSLKQYLEVLISLPYDELSEDNLDINHAKKILDESHYGMVKIKERILEFIAVAKLKESLKGRSILLVGPPGVGKTTIAKTIAKCLNRKFYRISLGGESDTSILKGHRRTYIGSYPGKIVKALKESKTENPVILLDEVDKITKSHKGNIMDVLLEVLDPVQNHDFKDNYLEASLDLSKVLFICSANTLDTITQPLWDRMEVIRLSGYTFPEKINIFNDYLIPKIEKEFETENKISINFEDKLIDNLLNFYARESGVRNLEKNLRKIYEKICYRYFIENKDRFWIKSEDLKQYLGSKIYSSNKLHSNNEVGLSLGLGYNLYGGSVLYIESSICDFKKEEAKDEEEGKRTNKGSIIVSGSLGDVMKESIEIAYTFSKEFLKQRFDNDFLEKHKIHIHFPAGASKKDGPSAGGAITSCILSLALNKEYPIDIAMTGEITLNGKILKIGGVKEKLLAAKREGITKMLVPISNMPDIKEIEDHIKENIDIEYIENYEQISNILFN